MQEEALSQYEGKRFVLLPTLAQRPNSMAAYFVQDFYVHQKKRPDLFLQ